MEQKLFSNKEICEICNVTRKQLRIYEEKGLLGNIIRNSTNNYRYYTYRNLLDLIMIKSLQKMGYSLNEIGDIMQTDDLHKLKEQMKKRVAAAKTEMEQSIQKYQSTIELYTQVLEAFSLYEILPQNPTPAANNTLANNIIGITDYPEQHMLSISYYDTFFDNEQEGNIKINEIINIANGYDISANNYSAFIYHDFFNTETNEFYNGKILTEVCVSATEKQKDLPHYKYIPPQKCIFTTHIGNYDDSFVKTYRSLFQWAHKHNYILANYSIEEPVINLLVTNNRDYWITNIRIPILGSK